MKNIKNYEFFTNLADEFGSEDMDRDVVIDLICYRRFGQEP